MTRCFRVIFGLEYVSTFYMAYYGENEDTIKKVLAVRATHGYGGVHMTEKQADCSMGGKDMSEKQKDHRMGGKDMSEKQKVIHSNTGTKINTRKIEWGENEASKYKSTYLGKETESQVTPDDVALTKSFYDREIERLAAENEDVKQIWRCWNCHCPKYSMPKNKRSKKESLRRLHQIRINNTTFSCGSFQVFDLEPIKNGSEKAVETQGAFGGSSNFLSSSFASDSPPSMTAPVSNVKPTNSMGSNNSITDLTYDSEDDENEEVVDCENNISFACEICTYVNNRPQPRTENDKMACEVCSSENVSKNGMKRKER